MFLILNEFPFWRDDLRIGFSNVQEIYRKCLWTTRQYRNHNWIVLLILMIRVNFYYLNLFPNNYSVYCRIFFYFFHCCHWIFIKNPILKIIPLKRTIYEDFKDWNCALAVQIFTVKTSDRSQMNPKEFLKNTASLGQLITRHTAWMPYFTFTLLNLYLELLPEIGFWLVIALWKSK